MKKAKQTIKKYWWQPELATSLIYWTLSSSLLFFSWIAFLEEMGLSIVGVFFLLAFLFFIGLSGRRYLFFTTAGIQISAIRRQNKQFIPLKNISKVAVGLYGLTIYYNFGKGEQHFACLMRKKIKTTFLNDLMQFTEFNGEIVSPYAKK